ncbi:EEF1A lysine methyltransferase 2-like [Anthonomus grandis grandis]|uniref:EEF1A lysine methyltransferase 2-like n=1 Tax=Anthonomus grandis grandis TaxID=2921223 RepID=UPI00216691D4|nr:EEF1A lysine methyltransferase 2-like [Anthonomus grandis grandis]
MLDDELGSSELGTLEFWEARYDSEIQNFKNHGDPGEAWFGEDIVDRIIKWISENVDKNVSIADLGCGNGHVLIELAQLGYTKLIGLDYSEKAICLANTIKDNQSLNIKYEVNDILLGLNGVYNVIHDKGTYDAISLSENSKEFREKYRINVHSALEARGYFIITSCNWTEEELKEHFKEGFELHCTIPTPQFKFGGKVGSVVSICVFKKK